MTPREDFARASSENAVDAAIAAWPPNPESSMLVGRTGVGEFVVVTPTYVTRVGNIVFSRRDVARVYALMDEDDVLCVRGTQDVPETEQAKIASYLGGKLIINHDRYEVTVAGTPITPRPKEFDLLVLLTENAERTVPHSEIADEVWGEGSYEFVRQSMRVYVSHVRKLLGEFSAHILTVPFFGYMFTEKLPAHPPGYVMREKQ